MLINKLCSDRYWVFQYWSDCVDTHRQTDISNESIIFAIHALGSLGKDNKVMITLFWHSKPLAFTYNKVVRLTIGSPSSNVQWKTFSQPFGCKTGTNNLHEVYV